jgi:hypothetical protein
MTPDWMDLKQRAIEGLDPDFLRHLRSLERPVQITYARIMAAYEGEPVGIELRHKDMACWAFVLPNVSSPEPWRSQYFDDFAISRHECHYTLESALISIIREGYRIPDPGALDRAAKGEKWKQGLAWTEKVRAMSRNGF